MKRLASLFVGILALAACGGGGPEGSYDKMDYAVQESRSAAPAPPPPAPMVEPNMGNGSSQFDDLPQRAGLFLAYTHSRSISVPGEGMKALLDEHAEICNQAGPKLCIVTSTNISGLGTEYANGYINIRAEPQWAETFLGNLPTAVKSAGASVTESSTSSVDLTAQIIDTDARLNAQTTLRDRLQKLLETRDGNLEELLGVERELARVQGQIDSYAATLANLKQRVAMSNVNLYYQARTSPVSQSVWRPLMNAFGDFFGNVAGALAAIVTLIAWALPWIPVIVGLIWLFRFFWRRIMSKKKAPAES